MSSKYGAERGSILIFLVASVTLLAGAIYGLLAVEQHRAARARTEIERNRAFTIAESGVDHVAVLLSANAWPAGSSLDWSSDGLDNDGDGLVDEGDESLRATADRWWADGLDNDGDGATDETDERVARVSCTVPIGVSTVDLTGYLRAFDSDLPVSVPAALTILDPNADVRFAGNAFRVGGNDLRMNGTPGTGTPVHGIAIDGATSQITSQLGNQQLDNVTGVGGWPSVRSWSPSSDTWLPDLVGAMAPLANVHFTNYPSTFTGNLGNAQTGSFLVTHSNGSLRIGGGSRGAGVLLVEGDLEVSGGWEYVGYIFVTGRLRMTGGGGGSRVLGAIFVGGDVEQSALSLTTTITGTVDLLYSSEALRAVRTAMSRYRVVALTEP